MRLIKNDADKSYDESCDSIDSVRHIYYSWKHIKNGKNDARQAQCSLFPSGSLVRDNLKTVQNWMRKK